MGIYFTSGIDRAKEMAEKADICDRIATGLKVFGASEIANVKLDEGEIFIKTKHAIPPEIKEYLVCWGWTIDCKRRGVSFKNQEAI